MGCSRELARDFHHLSRLDTFQHEELLRDDGPEILNAIADGQNDDRDAMKVLLELYASVCSDEHLEADAHGGPEKRPVLKTKPSLTPQSSSQLQQAIYEAIRLSSIPARRQPRVVPVHPR